MMASNTEIQLNEEKFLFAVDMVSFLLNKRYPTLSSDFSKSEIVQRADAYRARVRSRFNENMKKMVQVIDETQSVLVRRDFLEMKDKSVLNESSLRQYSDLHKVCDLDKGFEPGSFLMYCTRMVAISCELFSLGRDDALRLVVELVESAFPADEDKCKLIWDDLDNASLKYADDKSDSQGDSTSYFSRREPAEVILSETEESSTSSTINSESDSVAEMQNTTSTSSGEYFSAAVTKLDVSNMECTDSIQRESKQSPAAAEENIGGSKVVDTSSIESCSSKIVTDFVISNIEETIKHAFWKVEGESAAQNTPAKSPIKSCLGKRPSPRKGQASGLRGTSLDKPSGSSDDSETEIKKPKLSLSPPETRD